MVQLRNFHILEVKYLRPTTRKWTRVSIKSNRFEQRIIIDYDCTKGSILEAAIDYLKENGFELVGYNESNKGYFVVSTTFKPLK